MAMEWGKGKVEVYALRDEIFERLGRGQTIRSIYEELCGAGRIVVSQRPFYRHVNRLLAESQRHTQTRTHQCANTTRHARTPEPTSKPAKTPPASAEREPTRTAASLQGLRFGSAGYGSTPDVDENLWAGGGVSSDEEGA